MRLQRIAAMLAATTIGLGLAACGGDDNDEPAEKDTTERTEQTTTSEAQRDPAVKAAFQEAIGGYNDGYDKFLADLRRNTGPNAIKEAIADYRTVIFEFDKDLRAIEFPDELVVQVNSILENNRRLIAQLDTIGQAPADDVMPLFEEFQRDRGPQIKAINNLLDQL